MFPTCIFQGVPPSRCPTLRSWSISPATADETQTTAATPSTAATPFMPVAPMTSIRRAAMMRVDRVRPEMGLLEDPIVPTRFPETAAKKKPATAITPAARIAGG